jgi:hypothetical protein
MLLKISGICSLILSQFVGFNPLINLATCFDSPSLEAYYVLIVFEFQRRKESLMQKLLNVYP